MNYENRDSLGIYRSFQNENNPAALSSEDGPGPHLMGADTLIGTNVFIHEGLNLGDIKEIMLDMRTGGVSYAVLEFGGFLGLGAKLFAVPWSALTLDTVYKRFIVNMTKVQLEKAPGFDKDDWPDMADPMWEQGIHDFYGTKPYSRPL